MTRSGGSPSGSSSAATHMRFDRAGEGECPGNPVDTSSSSGVESVRRGDGKGVPANGRRFGVIKRISFGVAVRTMFVLIVCLVVFHVLVLAGVVPSGIVWGGRLANASEMRTSEAASIAILVIAATVISTRAGYLRRLIPPRGAVSLTWLLVVLFTLNTVGNLLAKSTLETLVFAPLSLASAVLCLRIALGR